MCLIRAWVLNLRIAVIRGVEKPNTYMYEGSNVTSNELRVT